ncbi:hypothetical protein [Dyadobacter frigoris]|uniref:PBCV-specific basic adaptor domain-containing protein n=1 Tax=Dyadobacter frigoris TaxID=2576211 RepID=A0A4U6DBJ9_9BACT|nr:hypothetical protein [Dyadobacter frigoris]TKT94145.1 hypothetical protein FDK13_02735 [Dyadobacter frigoris]
MKKVIYSAILIAIAYTSSFSQSFYPQPTHRSSNSISSGSVNPNTNYNSGYQKSNGTYVQPHIKTQQNQTNLDNYSTQGNVNPYTLDNGTKAKDYSIDAYNYGSGKTIQTGERGGQYYINNNGNKVYVPKR